MTKIIVRKKKQDTEEQQDQEQEGQQCNTVVKPLKQLKPLKPLKPLPDVISINNYALLLENDYDYKVIDLKKCALKSREITSIKK